MGKGPFKMRGYNYPGPSPVKKGDTKKKQWYVDNYEENKDKPGFLEAMDKAFGGKTKMKGRTSITEKNK